MRCFPLNNLEFTPRDHLTTLKHAKEVVKLDRIRHVMGVKGPSIMCLLPKYDIINGTVPDYMHAVFFFGCSKSIS